MAPTHTNERHLSHESRWSAAFRQFPKVEVIYFTQVVLIYSVVIACVVNLSFTQGNQSLWSSLLSGCLGYLLPSPNLGKRKHEPLLSDAAEQ